MNFYGFLISFLLFATFIVFELLNYRRIEKLLDRLMSRNFEEYKYFSDKWPGDLKEYERLREESRIDREKEREQKPVTDDNIEFFEEDWQG